MQKLLFIGHTYHLKTKSSVFLLDMLKEHYEVSELYMDPDKPDGYSEFGKFSGITFDILVIWQIIPKISKLKKSLHWRRGVFFPMYDQYQVMGGLKSDIWKRFRKFLVICFSKTMERDLAENGFDTRYIQFFPEPAEVENWGDSNSLFFWQRLSFLNLSTLAKATKPLDIHHIHIQKSPDPGHEILPLSAYDEKTQTALSCITFSESAWFEKKSDLGHKMEESAFYMAPRHAEGIGMSFLEAMAHGRCVIAPDTATMNEYITDGVNGLLYPWKFDEPSHCGASIKLPTISIADIQRNAYQTIADGHSRWEMEKENILVWLQEDACPDVVKLMRCALAYRWVRGYKRFFLRCHLTIRLAILRTNS